MAASRDLSQDLEVKVDTKEQRNRLTADFPNAKNWTRFHVKIEAIQCFPCYVKVTLMRNNVEGNSTNPLIVRITIPGLHVQLAASRTKPHCYGLFWKSNRKRCSIFLAFPSEQDRCMHMSWMKEAISDLERYRQDFLEIRRASRCSAEITTDHNQVRLTDVFSNYQNLGPLPPVPVTLPSTLPPIGSPLDFSRRQSAVSGIYEEIADPEVNRRDHIKSTEPEKIYERLYRRRSNTVTQSLLAQTPPPLPPRQRINTLDRDDGLSPIMGSPDSDTLKKKKYKTVLESIFGKQGTTGNTRKNSESSCSTTSTATTDADEMIRERFNVDLMSHKGLHKNKRHSISTPELANWDEGDEGDFMDPLNRVPSNNTDSVDFSEWQDVSCMSLLSESMDLSGELNISDKIRPNYNLSMNASTVNLVGCNFNAVRESEMGLRDIPEEKQERRSLNQINGGYCVMKPIPSQSPSEEDLEGVNVLEQSERSSGYCPMGPMGFDREHLKDMDQQPVRGIVFNEERVKMLSNNITMTRGEEIGVDELIVEEESFLRRKVKPTGTPNRETTTSSKDEDLYENWNCKDNRSSRGSKYLVDDKLPSYFPNQSPPPVSQQGQICPSSQITPPKLVPKQRSRASMTPSPRLQHYSPRAVPNIYEVPRNNSPVLMDNARDTEMLKQSLTDSISKLSLISNSNSSSPLASQPGSPGVIRRSMKKSETMTRDEVDGKGCKGSPKTRSNGNTPRTPEKGSNNNCETITSPVSSHKYLDKCSLKADFVNLKRFASLPRFRKLDLSPLRIKLNSVLHRHNSEF